MTIFTNAIELAYCSSIDILSLEWMSLLLFKFKDISLILQCEIMEKLMTYIGNNFRERKQKQLHPSRVATRVHKLILSKDKLGQISLVQS